MNVAPCIRTTSSDGKIHIAVFGDPGSTAATEHITLNPQGEVEERWGGSQSPNTPKP